MLNSAVQAGTAVMTAGSAEDSMHGPRMTATHPDAPPFSAARAHGVQYITL